MNNPLGMILTSVDDASMAKMLAKQMVEAGLAACVQISAAGTSIYRWQGKMQQSTEYFLTIKTNPARFDAIKNWLKRHHPYDTPEIIMLEGQAAEAYAAWVDDSTACVSNPQNEAKHV